MCGGVKYCMMRSNTHCYELNVRSCPLLEEDRTATSTQRLTGGGEVGLSGQDLG